MAGDLEYFATLNDAQFQAAMKRLDRTIEHERAKMERVGFFRKQLDKEVLGISNMGRAVGIGVASAFGLGAKGVAAFAQDADFAQAKILALGEATNRVFSRVGENAVFAGALDAMTQGLTKSIELWDSLGEAVEFATSTAEKFNPWSLAAAAGFVASGNYGAAGNTLAQSTLRAIGESGAGESARDRADAKRQDARNRIGAEVIRLNRDLSRQGLDGVDAARAEGNEIWRRTFESLSKHSATGRRMGLGTNELSDLFEPALAEADAARSRLIERAEKAERERAAADDDRSRREGERVQREADALAKSVRDQEHALEIQTLKVAGLDDEAERLSTVYGLEERRANLVREGASAEQLARFDAASTGLIGLTGRSRPKYGANVLDAGLGGSRAVAGITFGVGGTGSDATSRIARSTQESAQTLRRIEERLQTGPSFQ